MIVYVGAATAGNLAGDHAAGVSVFDLEPARGTLSHLQTLDGLDNPTWIARHPTLPILYAAERHTTMYGPGETLDGSLTACAIDPNGLLERGSRRAAGGAAYISVHPAGSYVLAAIPRSGCVMAHPLDDQGQVGPPTGIVQHQGRGINPSTWEGPYPHSVFLDQTGQRVLACDMGLDRIMLHDLDLATGRLQPSARPFAQLSSGGPGHLAIHPSNRFVYTVNELTSTVSAFAYDAETSTLRIIATLSSLPDDFDVTRHNSGAQILVHPTGQFLYSSNRGHNSIAAYALDEQTGRPRITGWTSTDGETPRNFNIDPSGRLLVVANQRSGNLVTFWIDETTGQLTPTGEQIATPSPTCIQFGAP